VLALEYALWPLAAALFMLALLFVWDSAFFARPS
jgi:hypothetical protein